jgi:hypothetical protein
MYLHQSCSWYWMKYGIDRASVRAHRGEAESDFNLHRMGIHPSDHLDGHRSISIFLSHHEFGTYTTPHYTTQRLAS